jgi:uncharacterized protein
MEVEGVSERGGATMAQAMTNPDREQGEAVDPAVEIPGKYLSLTSYKRDGTAVATPVWFVQEGRAVFIETGLNSFKMKRILRNPAVTIAPCTPSGRTRGEPVPATARLLDEAAWGHVKELMAKKYRADRILVLPIYNLVQKLQGKAVPRDQQRPVFVEITPAP